MTCLAINAYFSHRHWESHWRVQSAGVSTKKKAGLTGISCSRYKQYSRQGWTTYSTLSLSPSGPPYSQVRDPNCTEGTLSCMALHANRRGCSSVDTTSTVEPPLLPWLYLIKCYKEPQGTHKHVRLNLALPRRATLTISKRHPNIMIWPYHKKECKAYSSKER